MRSALERTVEATEAPSAGPLDEAVLWIGAITARIVLSLLAVYVLSHTGIRPSSILSADVYRYGQIAHAGGQPYRSFQVEYPPITLGLILLLAGPTLGATALRVGVLSFLLDIITAVLVRIGWGRRAALWYLVLGLPLSLFLYVRLDLVSVALAVAGVVLAKRGRERTGGLLLALGVFSKLWPLALAPLLAVERRWRALAWMAGLVLIGLVTWVAWAGPNAPRQVLSFRGATGWEIESLVGAVVWVLTTQRPVDQAGALRVGHVSTVEQAVLGLVLVAISAVVWWNADRARRLDLSDRPAEGRGALGAVAALLLLSPVLSAQYAIWLVPWAAIAAAEDEVLTRLTLAVTALTAGMWFLPGPTGMFWILLVVRNAVLVWLMVRIVRARKRPVPEDPIQAPLRGT